MAKKSDPTPESTASAPAQQTSGSVLDSLRHNQVGGLFAGLIVALGVGLLLSVLVPDDPHALALTLLGLLLAAAVGFTVRYLTLVRNLSALAVGFVTTVIGVHVMTVVGMVGGELPFFSDLGAASISFNDAFVASMATPAVAVGPVLTGLIAVVIVGWGPHPARDVADNGTHQI